MVHKPRQGMSPDQVREQHARDEQQFHYNVNQTINSLSNALESLSQRFEGFSSGLFGYKTDISINAENHRVSVLSDIKVLSSRIDQSEVKQKQFLEAVSLMLSLFPSTYLTKENFESVQTRMEKAMSELAEDHKRFKEELNAVMHKLSMDYDVKLEQFKKEILGKPSEVPSLRKELIEKIDLVSMDGSNSLLRSTNNEKQILLIEKKIENLYLMLKKLDLNKDS